MYLKVVNDSKPNENQPTISSFTKENAKYSSNDSHQLDITNALILFIAGDLMLLSVVDSNYFRNFVGKLDSKYQIPSRRHLSSKLIHDKAEEVKTNAKQKLGKAQSVSLTIDLWSNHEMRGFRGVTGHYILNWQLNSVMICCKRFKGKHNYENIRHEYEEAVATFEITDKISCVISDNASNMIKAFDFSLPGFECNADQCEDGSGEDYDCEETDDDNEELKDCLPRHSRCFAHTLQLVIKDGLRDCSSNLKNIINKASNIVSFVRKSVIGSELLEEENRLQSANATRWNSQLHMLKSILKVPEQKLDMLDIKFKLSTYERKLLTELCGILDPFEHATLLVQQEINVSASLTIPVTLGLKQISTDYNTKMVRTLVESIKSRLSPYESDDIIIVAAFVDPRFKVRWCQPDNVDKTVLFKPLMWKTIHPVRVHLLRKLERKISSVFCHLLLQQNLEHETHLDMSVK